MKILISCFLAFFFFYFPVTAQWYWQNPLPQGNRINDVVVLDDNTMVGCCDYGTIIRKDKGVNAWEVITLTEYPNLEDIAFFNDDYGIIVPDEGYVLLSDDQGKTWDAVIFISDRDA